MAKTNTELLLSAEECQAENCPHKDKRADETSGWDLQSCVDECLIPSWQQSGTKGDQHNG